GRGLFRDGSEGQRAGGEGQPSRVPPQGGRGAGGPDEKRSGRQG
ncbi:hypothetical protein AVEN_99981-1, partial [Araneus ventricosus]